ncbi:MAG: hypothetical protein LUE27_06755 [Clostridia bacterium]|nr:hypothetical protein [Clostridia bacterium]
MKRLPNVKVLLVCYSYNYSEENEDAVIVDSLLYVAPKESVKGLLTLGTGNESTQLVEKEILSDIARELDAKNRYHANLKIDYARKLDMRHCVCQSYIRI